MTAPTAAAFVEDSLQRFRFGTKQIVGVSGKSYTVPIVRIAAGTLLYSATPYKSGFKEETLDKVDTQSGMWLSWLRETALVYSNEGPAWFRANFDLRVFTAKRDLDLLDLWTSDGWNAVLREADANKALAAEAQFAGILEKTSDFVQESLNTGMFPGAKCIDPAPDAKECRAMEWKGVPWGPDRGQFKRSSDGSVDTYALGTLYSLFGPEAFDGMFARPLPSPDAQYTGGEQPMKVFHEEINLRPLFSEKLLVHDIKTGKVLEPQPDPSTFGPFFPSRYSASGSIPPAPLGAKTEFVESVVVPTVVAAETWRTFSDKFPPPPPPPEPSDEFSNDSGGLSNAAPGFSNNGGRRKKTRRRGKKHKQQRKTRKQ